jgi:hypothetical protein
LSIPKTAKATEFIITIRICRNRIEIREIISKCSLKFSLRITVHCFVFEIFNFFFLLLGHVASLGCGQKKLKRQEKAKRGQLSKTGLKQNTLMSDEFMGKKDEGLNLISLGNAW